MSTTLEALIEAEIGLHDGPEMPDVGRIARAIDHAESVGGVRLTVVALEHTPNPRVLARVHAGYSRARAERYDRFSRDLP